MNISIPKPRLRGKFHLGAFFVSLVTGPILIAVSNSSRVGAAVFSVAMTSLFGVSALYHTPDWKPKVRKWLRKLDHSMIFVLIAGTATPFALIIGTTWASTVLIILWSSALLGALITLLPISAPKPVIVIPYLALGWLGITLLPQGYSRVGLAPGILLGLGGVLYTLGAIAYARRSPNPKPTVFGYHEIFHLATVVASYLHYAAIAVALA